MVAVSEFVMLLYKPSVVGFVEIMFVVELPLAEGTSRTHDEGIHDGPMWCIFLSSSSCFIVVALQDEGRTLTSREILNGIIISIRFTSANYRSCRFLVAL